MPVTSQQLAIPLKIEACACLLVHRSHRRGMKDFLNRLIGRYPFRCRQCDRRFYRFRRR